MSIFQNVVRAQSDIDPFVAENLKDPFGMQQTLRDLGPVVWLERYDVYALARHANVSAALRDPASFSSAAGVGLTDLRRGDAWRPPSLLLEADPPDHTKARRVITSVLTPRVVASFKEAFHERAATLVDEAIERGDIDAVAEIAEAFPLTVFPDAVGLDPAITLQERQKLLIYGRMVNNGFGPRNEVYERAMDDAVGTSDWVMAQCQASAVRPGSLADQIHQVAVSSGYSEADGAMILRSLLSAGVETTVNAIANALLAFAENPFQWSALRSTSAVRPAFEELLRYDSPVQVFFRTATREIQIDEDIIPEDARVMLLLGSANRDPRTWDSPDAFDIERRTAGHVGFGFGIHACVGQMMARLEGEAVLKALSARATTLELTAPPERLLNNTLRGLETLPLRLSR